MARRACVISESERERFRTITISPLAFVQMYLRGTSMMRRPKGMIISPCSANGARQVPHPCTDTIHAQELVSRTASERMAVHAPISPLT